MLYRPPIFSGKTGTAMAVPAVPMAPALIDHKQQHWIFAQGQSAKEKGRLVAASISARPLASYCVIFSTRRVTVQKLWRLKLQETTPHSVSRNLNFAKVESCSNNWSMTMMVRCSTVSDHKYNACKRNGSRQQM